MNEDTEKILLKILRKLKKMKNLLTLRFHFTLSGALEYEIKLPKFSCGYFFHLTSLVTIDIFLENIKKQQMRAIWKTVQENHKTLKYDGIEKKIMHTFICSTKEWKSGIKLFLVLTVLSRGVQYLFPEGRSWK